MKKWKILYHHLNSVDAREEWEEKMDRMSPSAKIVYDMIIEAQEEYGSMSGRAVRGNCVISSEKRLDT